MWEMVVNMEDDKVYALLLIVMLLVFAIVVVLIFTSPTGGC